MYKQKEKQEASLLLVISVSALIFATVCFITGALVNASVSAGIAAAISGVVYFFKLLIGCTLALLIIGTPIIVLLFVVSRMVYAVIDIHQKVRGHF